ncbi:MAG: ABC transporter permease [Oscillospiraceae bacterium]|nr:ABC transporter permease [Oscillospiraceae bacterium]
MIRYIIKRLLMMIPILMGVSLIVLIFIDIAPGDPARIKLGNRATEEQIQELREEWHLNDPFLTKYFTFLGNAVRGDFGRSYNNNRPITTEMAQRFKYTFVISVLSVLLSVVIGIPLGIYAATHQYTWKDNAAIALSLLCISMPAFWFALILIRFFSIRLGWLPPQGIESWKGWIMPTISLALGYTALITRQMRSDLLEVIRQDFITTARAKGQTEMKVLYRHALKNAIIPIVLIIGTLFGASLGGAMIAEIIYSVPGLGSYMLSGLTARDYPVILATTFFMSTVFSIVILLIDVAFAFIDPRIRSQYSRKKVNKEKVLKGVGQ